MTTAGVVLLVLFEVYLVVAVVVAAFVAYGFWRSDSGYRGLAACVFALLGALMWPYTALDWLWYKWVGPFWKQLLVH